MKYIAIIVEERVYKYTRPQDFYPDKSPLLDNKDEAQKWLNEKIEKIEAFNAKSSNRQSKRQVKQSAILAIDEEKSEGDYDKLLNFITEYFNN